MSCPDCKDACLGCGSREWFWLRGRQCSECGTFAGGAPDPPPSEPKSVMRLNAEADPNYRPYCLRCSTMIRMALVAPFYWQCVRCGAEHDERRPGDAARVSSNGDEGEREQVIARARIGEQEMLRELVADLTPNREPEDEAHGHYLRGYREALGDVLYNLSDRLAALRTPPLPEREALREVLSLFKHDLTMEGPSGYHVPRGASTDRIVRDALDLLTSSEGETQRSQADRELDEDRADFFRGGEFPRTPGWGGE